MSHQITRSTQAEDRLLHPALRYLARAIAAYRRSGFKEDEEAFETWAICHFDQDDYEKAFAEITALPEFMTREAGYQYAEDFIKRVGPELQKKKLANDTVSLWLDEIAEYKERRRKKRDGEADRAEDPEKSEEVERALEEEESGCWPF